MLLLNSYHFSLDFMAITHFSISDISDNIMLFAQNSADLKKVDVIGDISKAWANYVKTGQLWATLIGVFFGYTFRSFLP